MKITIDQMEQELRNVNFFVGGLTNEQMELYYNRLVQEGIIKPQLVRNNDEAMAAEHTGRGTGEGYVEMVCINAIDKEDVLTTGETYLVRVNRFDKMARIKGSDQKFRLSRFVTADKYKERFCTYPSPKEAREIFRLAKNEGFSKKEAKAIIIRQYYAIAERFDLVEGILNTIYDNE